MWSSSCRTRLRKWVVVGLFRDDSSGEYILETLSVNQSEKSNQEIKTCAMQVLQFTVSVDWEEEASHALTGSCFPDLLITPFRSSLSRVCTHQLPQRSCENSSIADVSHCETSGILAILCALP